MIRTIQSLLAASALAACDRHTAVDQIAAPKDGARETVQLKAGHGLSFHPRVLENIGLQVAEVAESKVAPEFTAELHVVTGAGNGLRKIALETSPGAEASGWVSPEKAAFIKPGQEVFLRFDGATGAQTENGVVRRVEKSAYAAVPEFEVAVQTEAPLETGTRVLVTFRSPAGEAVPCVPRSALLRTAEGTFVYAVNESFYLRTPVKIGATNHELIEITDGLYAGDQIVVSPVQDLWMAELQILRGGKACSCGH